jgi:hypothetical protein
LTGSLEAVLKGHRSQGKGGKLGKEERKEKQQGLLRVKEAENEKAILSKRYR